MGRHILLAIILGLAIANGILSPFRLIAQVIVFAMAPALLISSPSLVLLASSLLTATATLMLGGVPAALFERLTGKPDSTSLSLAIWLAAVAILSLPALDTLVRVLP